MDLYPFQVDGALWLSKQKRAYLGDVMGLGKTIQAISAAIAADARNILVICPASMVGTWELEILLWSDWRRTFRVISYDTYVRRGLDGGVPDLLICDEAHYLKGLDTKRTKAILQVLVPRMERVWLLSGTPTPNGPHELWTVMKYVRPDLLKQEGIRGYTDWLNTFTVWSQGLHGPRIHNAKNVPLLRELIKGSGFMLRRKFSDVEIDLPDLDLRTLPLKGVVSKELAQLMDRIERQGFTDYGELPPESEHVATTRRLLGEHKAALLSPMVYSDLANDDSHCLALFAYHTNVLDSLEHDLRKFDVARIDGSTPKKKRTKLVQEFQGGEHRVFLSQITAGGVGITLTRAHDVLIAEPSWVPGENSQAIARVLRISQKMSKVSARIAVLSGTLDDKITAIVTRKEIMIASTLDG